MDPNLISWLITLPCVLNRDVVIDTREVLPVAIIGVNATRVSTRDEFIYFIMNNLGLAHTFKAIG